MKNEKKLLKIRFGILSILVYLVTILLLFSLFRLQILDGAKYREKAKSRLIKEQDVESLRGNIIDRTGTILAGTKLSYDLYITEQNIDAEEINEIGKKVISILLKNGEKINNPLPISFETYEFVGGEKKIAEWKEKHKIAKEATGVESFKKVAEKFKITSTDDVEIYNISVYREMLSQQNTNLNGIKIAEKISSKTVSEIEENSKQLKGVKVVSVANREYPKNNLASHTIGYISRINDKEYKEKKAEGYKNSDFLGKTGIEKTFEKLLKGTPGKKQLEISLEGEVLEEYVTKEAVGGANIILTIDEKLQKVTEEALKKTLEKMKNGGFGKKYNPQGAAAVVLDVRTGEVLAAASYPDYVPEDFNGGITAEKWKEYNNNPRNPLLNRVIQGEYAPASTYKMMMSLAALNEGVTTIKEKIRDTGIYPKGQLPKCWIYGISGGGHGLLNVVGALKNSCNYYFYEMGMRLGIDKIEKYERYFGLGEKTGIELSGEKKGTLSSREQTKKENREFNERDLLSTSIGQSYNSYTPMQLAKYIAMVANGGRQVYPTIIKNVVMPNGTSLSKEEIRKVVEEATGEKTEQKENMEFKKEHIEAVLDGMKSVTGERGGTAYTVFKDFDIEVGGKTGSAEVSDTRTDGLFVGFAPFNKPEIAVVTIIENGEVGFHTSEVVLDIMKEYFGINVQNVREDMKYEMIEEGLL